MLNIKRGEPRLGAHLSGEHLMSASRPRRLANGGWQIHFATREKPKLGARPQGAAFNKLWFFMVKSEVFRAKPRFFFDTLVSTRGRLRRPLYLVETKGQGVALGGKIQFKQSPHGRPQRSSPPKIK